MTEGWEEYESKTEARCEYCGCSRMDMHYIEGKCCCGMEWKVEYSSGVELEGFNNIDVALEMKR